MNDPIVRALVVVPARDEAQLIGACIESLAAQRGIAPDEWEILLVLDGCSDETAANAFAALAATPEIGLHLMETAGLGAGGARAAGMDAACDRLESAGRIDGLIATTDADSEVAPDWLARQLEVAAGGAEAIGGLIVLDPEGSRHLAPESVVQRNSKHEARMAALVNDGPTEHPFFGGASLAITGSAYRRVGGMEPLEALEDEALAAALRANGIAIHRLNSVRVTTSVRLQGRASAGLARNLHRSERLLGRA